MSQPDDFDSASSAKLFKAVVLHAFHDACMDIPRPRSKKIPPDFKPRLKEGETVRQVWARRIRERKKHIDDVRYHRDDARKWLLGNCPDFRKVCELAYWEPEYIRLAAQRVKRAGWQLPKNRALKGHSAMFGMGLFA